MQSCNLWKCSARAAVFWNLHSKHVRVEMSHAKARLTVERLPDDPLWFILRRGEYCRG
jgi:hypothetical protein